MGRKSLVVSGVLVLGIREMKVWFRLSIIEPELRISREAAITSLLIKF